MKPNSGMHKDGIEDFLKSDESKYYDGKNIKIIPKMTEQKRTFQVLDEMNQEDVQNKTEMVQVCTSLISANKVKGGASVSIGVPESVLYDIINDKLMPILILVDKDEYFKRSK